MRWPALGWCSRRCAAVLACAVALGCGGVPEVGDAGEIDGSVRADGGPPIDAGPAIDSGPRDSGDVDAFDPDPNVDPPRPIAPLTTATVTSPTPQLEWQLATRSDGARIELCQDRAMTSGCSMFDAIGTMGAPPTPLTPGVWFWRLHGRRGATTGATTSPIWHFRVGVTPSGGRTRAATSYGSYVDVNGDGYVDLAIGAYDLTTANEGALYVYFGSASGLPDTPSVTITRPATSIATERFPAAIADAGDLDGDGYTDLAVGRLRDNTRGAPGPIHVYYGGPTGPGDAVAVPSTIGGFGAGVVGIGDVDHDGYADLYVGAEPAGGYVHHGSATGLEAVARTTLTPPETYFGPNAGRLGDLNADGYADFAVYGSSTSSIPGVPGSGSTYVYLGSATGAPRTTVRTLSIHPAVIVCAGDVNGDGYSDALFGESGAAGGGRAQLVFGVADPIYYGSTATPFAENPTHWWDYGAQIASARDVNADGYDDFAIGGNYSNDSFSRLSSGAEVFLGAAMGSPILMTTLIDVQDTDTGTQASLATLVGVGDVDGDGRDDLAEGRYQSTMPGQVKVYVARAWTPSAQTIDAPMAGYAFIREMIAAGP